MNYKDVATLLKYSDKEEIEEIKKTLLANNREDEDKSTKLNINDLKEKVQSLEKELEVIKPYIEHFKRMEELAKILKARRIKRQITYKRMAIRLSADFSTETLQVRREWHDIFKVMKGKKLQPRIFYTTRLNFRFDAEIKSFPHKQKLREFSTTKLALQQMLKGLI